MPKLTIAGVNVRAALRTILSIYERYRFPIHVFVLSRVVFLMLVSLANAAPINSAPDPNIWIRWDGGWYYTIADHGYRYLAETQSNIAFFPMLPILMRLVGFATGNLYTAGVLIVHVSQLGALIAAYALMRYETPDDPEAAERFVLYLAFAPGALFQSPIYTESLFLLLSLLAVLAARCRKWTLSAAAAMLAGAVRVVGVMIVVFLVLEWLRSHGFTLRTMFTRTGWHGLFTGLREQAGVVTAIALVPFGLFSYMAYLNTNYGEPFLFRDVQSAWGRSPDVLFLSALQNVRRVVESVLTGQPVILSEQLTFVTLIVMFILTIAVWHRFGTPYGGYTLATLLLTISASMVSVVRYASVIFPVFMVLALAGKRSRSAHYAILIIFCVLYGMLTFLFVRDFYFE